jgi:hypothetical protein
MHLAIIAYNLAFFIFGAHYFNLLAAIGYIVWWLYIQVRYDNARRAYEANRAYWGFK